MGLALGPRFLHRLLELARQEAFAKTRAHGLRLLRAVVVAEAIVGETQRLGKHPSLAIVLAQELLDTSVSETSHSYLSQQVPDRNCRENWKAEFRINPSVHSPESGRIESLLPRAARKLG